MMNSFIKQLLAYPGLLERFTLMDIGAMGGVHERFSQLGTALDVVGFEPDEEARSTLGPNIYPFALAGVTGPRTFYHAGASHSSGLYPCRSEYFSRLPCRAVNFVKNTSEILCHSLKDIEKMVSLPRIDFIKIDVEGAELEILEGASSDFLDRVLGVEVEVVFNETHSKRCLFADIDRFLRDRGFFFIKFTSMVGFKKNSLPLIDRHPYTAVQDACPVGADALYMRDPIEKVNASYYDQYSLIRIMVIHSLYNNPDWCLELLEDGLSKGVLDSMLVNLRDSLVPRVFGQKVTLDTYRNLVAGFHRWKN